MFLLLDLLLFYFSTFIFLEGTTNKGGKIVNNSWKNDKIKDSCITSISSCQWKRIIRPHLIKTARNELIFVDERRNEMIEICCGPKNVNCCSATSAWTDNFFRRNETKFSKENLKTVSNGFQDSMLSKILLRTHDSKF